MSFVPGTALEFFAGIGLARLGLERSGWTVTFANDNDPRKEEMHRGHWGRDAKYVLKNVFDVQLNEIPDAELAWASFPCVDLSLAGNRAGLKGHSSSAYWGFHDILDGLGAARRPPLVVLENVHGMLTSHDGDDLARIMSGLNALGYTTDLLSINAVHFVPQSRPRMFVIGARPPYHILTDQEPNLSELRPRQVLEFRKRHDTLSWGVAPIGKLPQLDTTLQDFIEQRPSQADFWWDGNAVQRLIDRMSDRHRAEVDRLSRGPTVTYGTVYRRVRPAGYRAEVRFDGIAGCLRTPRGGSSRQFVMEVGEGNIRARHMSAVEYGRLQGAPDFRIEVPEMQALFGFGDAVCVPVVSWLSRFCLEPIRRGVAAEQQLSFLC